MKNYKIWIVGFICGLTQLACSSSSDSGINYGDSVIAPTLEIPPDLISVKTDKNLVLPGSKVGTQENTGRFVETGNLNTEDQPQ